MKGTDRLELLQDHGQIHILGFSIEVLRGGHLRWKQLLEGFGDAVYLGEQADRCPQFLLGQGDRLFILAFRNPFLRLDLGCGAASRRVGFGIDCGFPVLKLSLEPRQTMCVLVLGLPQLELERVLRIIDFHLEFSGQRLGHLTRPEIRFGYQAIPSGQRFGESTARAAGRCPDRQDQIDGSTQW